ncbi:MAG: efflux RND transporter permease subunit [Gammaproteobacteria bacterium]
MIAAIIRWCIQNRFLVLLTTFFIVVAGIYAMKSIPVDAIPDLSDVQVIIETDFPGQAPQVIEDQITFPLMTSMLAVPGATVVRGESDFGNSYVYVIFEDGTDLYWARSRVLEYLNQITSQLPAGARLKLGPDATGVGWVYEYALIDRTHQHDISQLTSLQNWLLKYELQKVPGVAEIATVGGMGKQYQIVIHPDALRAYGLTITKVMEAIKNANQEVGGSSIEMAEAEYIIRSKGYLRNLQDFDNIPLGLTKSGTPILLSNVATIRIGPDYCRGVAELNGEGQVVGGVVVMRYGQNALATIDGIKAKLAELKSSLPSGVQIVETYNRSSLIHRAIDTLKDKLVEEFIIVSLVCMIFLAHFRSSLIIIISLPIGILIALIIMNWQGINANIMSLGGIAIAIGAMVDAAIVMIENVHKHLEREASSANNRWKLIQKAALEVGPALFFSLLIITFSFLPIFALQAQEGRLFKPLAFTKTYAMAGAAVLSITLVPVLMGYLIRGKIKSEYENPLNRFLRDIYKPIIDAVLKSPKFILAISCIVIVIGFFPLIFMSSEFMPELNEGDLLYMPSTFPSISIGKAQQLLQQTDKLIYTVPEVKTVFGKMGRAETATDPAPLSMMETTIQFKPSSEWRSGMNFEKIKAELESRLKLPGLSNVWIMPIRNRIDMLATGIKTPLGIKIFGPDLTVVQNIGEQIENLLKTIAGTTSVFAERVVSGRYINIDINRIKAARYGLNISDAQEMIKNTVGGMNITETIEGRERYPVNLRYPRDTRDSVEKLRQLPIVTPSGAHIPLDAVANVYITEGPDMIKSENVLLNGIVYIDISGRSLGSYVTEAQRIISEKIKIPAGYSLSWSGEYQYLERVKARLLLVIPLTLFIIAFLLYLNFRRFTEVLIIMGTLPLALIGGIWLIFLLGYYLSVAVAVGFIALSGVAVEIGVVMLVYLNQALAKYQKIAEEEKRLLTEKDIRAAIIDGALLRLRPIMMTVSAIIGGLLPIMLLGGTGSEVMRRIAAPMVGGMITATILTLIVIPAVFLIWNQWLLDKKRRNPSDEKHGNECDGQ